uniref:Eukaryotic translation initiation factor 3 subunit L n=1 Tax=Rhabditophanes sp. KR3021 TaxID=114890 RepID=A0AC35TWH2_9BILA
MAPITQSEGKSENEQLAEVPREVIQFICYFKKVVDSKDVAEIQVLYEQGFSEVNEKHYQDKFWPEPNLIHTVISEPKSIFMILYREIYYRDIYMKTNTKGLSLSNRFDAFMNYQDLFAEILNIKDDQPLDLVLPDVWLWDIIDEFIYQFVSYCNYKANPSHRSIEESHDLEDIEAQQSCWNIYPVLNILYSLLSKAQINQQLKAIREGLNPDDIADQFGRSDLYFKLGYFSLIGLLKIHVLLGDYHQALQTVEFLEMDPKGLYNTVPNCYVNLHYYVGYSHMMMRNYGEATKIFVTCLLYIQKTTTLYKVHNSNVQRKYNPMDFIIKVKDQMLALLCICLALQPQKIDESVLGALNDKHSDAYKSMSNGDLEEFKNCFLVGSPKFISPTVVAYEGASQVRGALIRQCNAFLEGLKGQIWLPVLRGYLKLYTSISVKKLAGFLNIPDNKLDDFIPKLLSFKMIVNELGKETTTGDDRIIELDDSTLDLDFYVHNDTIHVANTRVARKVTEFFLNNSLKLESIIDKAASISIKPPKTNKFK